MARRMIDVQLEDAEDLAIVAGDFIADESTGQHQRQLILNSKGDFKQNPTICVGTPQYMDDETLQNIVRAISVEFARDGMDVKNITLTPDGIIKSDSFYA